MTLFRICNTIMWIEIQNQKRGQKQANQKKKPQKQKTKQAKKLFSHGLQPFISLVKEARLMFPCTLPRQFFKIFFFLTERMASYIFVNKLECIYTFYFNTISNKFEKQENCPRFIIFTLPQISITYIFLFFFLTHLTFIWLEITVEIKFKACALRRFLLYYKTL